MKRPKNLADELGVERGFSCPEQEGFLNLVRTYERFASQFAKLFKQYGVSEPQYNVLRILRGSGEPMTVYSIAERLVSAQPDITRLLDRMEKNGLLSRRRCEKDRRVIWVSITNEGKRLSKKLGKPVMDLHQEQLGHLSRQDLKKLNELLFKCRESN